MSCCCFRNSLNPFGQNHGTLGKYTSKGFRPFTEDEKVLDGCFSSLPLLFGNTNLLKAWIENKKEHPLKSGVPIWAPRHLTTNCCLNQAYFAKPSARTSRMT